MTSPFNTKKEEEEEEILTIKDLPPEVWEEILLSSPLNLKDVTSLVNAIPDTKNYVQVIEADPNEFFTESKPIVSAKFLLLFPYLRKISRRYPVRVDTIGDFIKIAKSPLREVNLNISRMIKKSKYDEDYYDEIYSLIELFLNLKSLPSDFYFAFKVFDEEDGDLRFRLELYPWSFELYSPGVEPSQENLNAILRNFPITSFTTTGLSSDYISAFIENAPNLQVIDYKMDDHNHSDNDDWIVDALDYFDNLEEVNLISIKTDPRYYDRMISQLVDHLAQSNRSYPRIRRFLPVHVEDLANIEKIFPNLIEINLIRLPQEPKYLPYLEKYDQINVYSIYITKLPIIESEDDLLFDLKDRIYFVDIGSQPWEIDYGYY